MVSFVDFWIVPHVTSVHGLVITQVSSVPCPHPPFPLASEVEACINVLVLISSPAWSTPMALSGWLGPTAALTIVPYGLFMPLPCGPSYSSYLLVSYLSHCSVLLLLLCAPWLATQVPLYLKRLQETPVPSVPQVGFPGKIPDAQLNLNF